MTQPVSNVTDTRDALAEKPTQEKEEEDAEIRASCQLEDSDKQLVRLFSASENELLKD